MTTKKQRLDYLYYEVGKQNTPFRLTYSYGDKEEPKFSKWLPYFEAEQKKGFIEQANQRTQIHNEVILDMDEGDYKGLIEQLKKDGLRFEAYGTDKGRCQQIHLFYSGLAALEKLDRELAREIVIKKYGCDLAFRIDNHMIPLKYDGAKHWKTDQEIKLIERVEGINDALPLIKIVEGMKKEEKYQQSLKIDNYIQNVEEFYKSNPLFFDKSSIFWFWENDIQYNQIDDVDVMNMLDDKLGFMGQTVNSRIKNHYIEAFKRVGRKNIPMEAPSKWIQFNDVVFSINSSKKYKVEPNYFFTNPIPHEIGESEDTPTMDKLFIEWVGEEFKDTLYELIAYCCYRDYPIQLLFCLVGSGANGKGCFLKILDKFLGKDNVTSTSLDLISGNNKSRFESFRLYKKLVALMGETNFGLLTNTSLLKQLTGGDKIGFEKKGKDPFSDYNYAKIIIASNSLPTTQDTSIGFFRRWLIIDFPNEFPEGKDITTTIPDKEYNNLAKKVIRILPKLIKRGAFTNQGNIQERKDKYILSSNPIPLFISLCCDREDYNYVSYNELYTAYIKLLKILKKRRISRKEFRSSLEDEGLWIEKTAHKIGDGESGEWKTSLNIEGLGINLENFAFFTNNPTLFTRVREGVGKMVKKAKKEGTPKMKEETIEYTSPKDTIYQYIKQNPLKSYKDIQKVTNIPETDFIGVFEALKSSGDILEVKPDKWRVLE